MTQSAKVVLLVENDQDVSQQIRLAFEMAQVWTRIAGVPDGQQAMEYMKRFGKYADVTRYPSPSIIITELFLPGTDGFQLLGWLKMFPEFRHVPKVVLTGSRQEEDRRLAMGLGCSEYFVKPRGLLELVGIVERISESWLSERRAPLEAAGGYVQGFEKGFAIGPSGANLSPWHQVFTPASGENGFLPKWPNPRGTAARPRTAREPAGSRA